MKNIPNEILALSLLHNFKKLFPYNSTEKNSEQEELFANVAYKITEHHMDFIENNYSLVKFNINPFGEPIENTFEEENNNLLINVIRQDETENVFSISYGWKNLIYTAAYEIVKGNETSEVIKSLKEKGLFQNNIEQAIKEIQATLENDIDTILSVINYEEVYSKDFDALKPGWRIVSFESKLIIINEHMKLSNASKNKKKPWWDIF